MEKEASKPALCTENGSKETGAQPPANLSILPPLLGTPLILSIKLFVFVLSTGKRKKLKAANIKNTRRTIQSKTN